MKKIIFLCILALICLTTIIIKNPLKVNKSDLDLRNFDVDLENIDKVMIVAHPDDDMIWGGSHLIDDNYLVVCINCGAREDRVL